MVDLLRSEVMQEDVMKLSIAVQSIAPRPAEFNDPDAQNAEQAETGSQAQDVAADARVAALDRAEESEHGGKANPAQIIPDDASDLVDKMNEMIRSGQIDLDAYEGEEDMDDEAGE
jgi:hypothetical protein